MSSAESQPNRTTEIVSVPFYGDTVEAIYNTQDDTVYVSVCRVCENLDIDSDSQLKKLKGYHWTRTVMITVRDQLNKRQELTFLPLAQLPMWLTTINPSKIGASPELVEKLKHYQLEAVDVLAKHFVVPKPEPEPESVDPILAMLEAARVQRQAQLALESKVDKIQERVDDLSELRTASLKALHHVPRSDRPAKQLTTRAKVNMLVCEYHDASGVDYKDIWCKLYKEFRHRYHFDVYRRAENSGMDKLDVIEQAGKMEDFYAMASEILS
jgi:hypothetical protein